MEIGCVVEFLSWIFDSYKINEALIIFNGCVDKMQMEKFIFTYIKLNANDDKINTERMNSNSTTITLKLKVTNSVRLVYTKYEVTILFFKYDHKI